MNIMQFHEQQYIKKDIIKPYEDALNMRFTTL